MKSEMSILLIDDNPNDRLLVIRELANEFPKARVSEVTSADDFNHALNSGNFQLVVTDYQLRWTDGLKILQSVKTQWPMCAVIMFTGTGTEDVAVESMKCGLDDYIVKSPKHFYRLRAAARQALHRSDVRQALVEAESRYRHLIESAPDIIFATSPEGILCELNPAFDRITGLPVEKSLGQSFFSIIHPDDVPIARNALSLALSGETLPLFELRVNTKNGAMIFVEIKVTSRFSNGQITGILGIARDITQRKRIDEELRASRQRLEMLSRQLIVAQETERRHLARELHDEIGQVLTAIKMNLHRTEKAASTELLPYLKDNVAMVDQAIVQVRNLSLSLRPPQLDELGLVASLHWLTKHQANLGEFEVTMEFDLGDSQIQIDLETVCFRIVQEALTNAVRHGKPGKVHGKLWTRDQTLHLTIEDDGIGFDVDDNRRRALAGESFGLTSMQERARLVRGDVRIESAPGQGTTVVAWFPL